MTQTDPVIHLFAGGVGATVGAVITSPLDVVKTRLQSSGATWGSTSSTPPKGQHCICPNTGLPIDPSRKVSFITNRLHINNYSTASPADQIPRLRLIDCLRHIYRTDGFLGYFRGLGPNLVGVVPSRAIYFGTYTRSKEFYSRSNLTNSSWVVHLLSAGTAGFVCCTMTNPVWFLKTRLQLDENKGAKKLTVAQCARDVYKKQGIKGFYRGLTASYLGIFETAAYFVLYEKIKSELAVHADVEHDRPVQKFVSYFIASACCKATACVMFYPHEVARTRMREEGNVYKGVFQTLNKVAREEGRTGLYRGLVAQLIRAVPNSAIMMLTYEIVVYNFSSADHNSEQAGKDD